MKVKVCTWKTCKEKFSEYIFTRLQNDKKKLEMENLEIEKIPCMWNCKLWVNVCIWKETFSEQTPIKTSNLVTKKYQNENK